LRPGFPFPIDEDLWFIQADFFLGNKLNFHNNALIIKHEDTFIVVNMPHISKAAFGAIKKLADYEKAEVKYLLAPSDFNNKYVREWQKGFPGAVVCMVSSFALNRAKVLIKDSVTVLGMDQPEIKEAKESIQIYPILGITPKSEIAVYHKSSGTLFIADHLYPASNGGEELKPTVASFYIEPSISQISDKEPCNEIFNVTSDEQARDSFTNILKINCIKRLVFAHKSPAEGCIYMRDDIKEKLDGAYKMYVEF